MNLKVGMLSAAQSQNTINVVGNKHFSNSNHLGIVLNVITDRKLANNGGSGSVVAYYTADVVSFSDYDPFGMLMPERHGAGSDYRYGFQGQESDPEIKGEGNSSNYKYRMHDPRIGRFFTVDPVTKMYPHYSPYSFSGNRVIDAYELEGMEPAPSIKGKVENGSEGTTKTITEGNLFNSITYTLYYHAGGRLTQAGWYTNMNYEFITKPITQDHDACETGFSQSHPIDAWNIGTPDWDNDGDISSYSGAVSTNAKIAGEDKATMTAQNNDGTRQNAFRHAVMQALITYEINYGIAAEIGYAHEVNPNADVLLQGTAINDLRFDKIYSADQFVDLMNNRVARGMAQGWKNDGLVLTRQQAAIKTLEYFRDKGFYVTSQKEDGSVEIMLHKLTSDEFDRGKSNILNTDKNGFNKSDGDLYEGK